MEKQSKPIVHLKHAAILLGLSLLIAALSQPALSASEDEIKLRSNPADKLAANLKQLAREAYATGELRSKNRRTGGRTKSRQLFSFEDNKGHEGDGQAIPYLAKCTESMEVVWVKDNGVTDGEWCARITVPPGVRWASLEVKDPRIVNNWSDYDYFAMDVYVEDTEPYYLAFELRDDQSKDFKTRFTLENHRVRKGKQTMLFPISEARRNKKMEVPWKETPKEDRIDRSRLTSFKIFTTPRKDRPAVFWVDNLRLLQEDAAKPRLNISLPASAMAFNFGSEGVAIDGFKGVSDNPDTRSQAGGLASYDGIKAGGMGWPDLLTGTFLIPQNDKTLHFKARVPNGKYNAWLCAGPVITNTYRSQKFLLSMNATVLHRDAPDFETFDSEKYLYRFMWTQYSERPNALWLDYIDKMYPVWQQTVEVDTGEIEIKADSFFVSALILVPEKDRADYDRMAAKITTKRIAAFKKTLNAPQTRSIESGTGKEPYTLFIPDDGRKLYPDTTPTHAERARLKISEGAAQGQNVFMRVGVMPYSDLGPCELRISDLSGPRGSIPASAIKGFFLNYNFNPLGAQARTLLPSLSLRMEKGITQYFQLRLRIPAETVAGMYKGAFVFRTSKGHQTKVPVEVEVYPFKLESDPAFGYSMFYNGRQRPRPSKELMERVSVEQFRWKRDLGFTTATGLVRASLKALDAKAGTTVVRIDDSRVRYAEKAGFLRNKKQIVDFWQLGLARRISRKLQPWKPGEPAAPVDVYPGIEFKHPRFKACWMDAMKKVKRRMEELGYRYVVFTVDEPRSHPNPWNRNLTDTNRYGDWAKEAGFPESYVTPMADTSRGEDYTNLIEHHDIISTHPSPKSRKLMEKTKAKGKELWFYNGDFTRETWGVRQFKHGSRAFAQWHWSFVYPKQTGGYPGLDWFNPFTAVYSPANNAPIADYPGGFIPGPLLFSLADGITDMAYINTLLNAISANEKHGTERTAVSKAKSLLESIKAETPDYSSRSKRLDYKLPLRRWRREMAQSIIALRGE